VVVRQNLGTYFIVVLKTFRGERYFHSCSLPAGPSPVTPFGGSFSRNNADDDDDDDNAYAGVCRPTWTIRQHTHSMGGTLIVEPISAADCLSRCAMSATCVAADLVNRCTPPQCWLHYRRENILRRYRAINITQYEVVTRCATIAPPTTGNCSAYDR